MHRNSGAPHPATYDDVLLSLKAWFPSRSDKECGLLCDTATDVLILFNDAKARKAVAEALGGPVGKQLKSIPTDDILAPLLGVPLAALRASRRTGSFDHFMYLGRTAGRRPWDRTAFHVDWHVPGNYAVSRFGPPENPVLTVSLNIPDIPSGQELDLIAVIDRFFHRAASAGAFFASGHLYPLHRRPWCGGHLESHEPPQLGEAARQRIWAELGTQRQVYLPDVRHMMLLTTAHLKKLGGRSQFVKEIKAFGRSDPAGYPPQARALIGESLYLWADEHLIGSDGGGMRIDSMAVNAPDRGAAWLLARFAQAGLLAEQAPSALDAMQAYDEVVKRRGDVREASATDGTAELEAREAAFAEYMRRMWLNPPTFIAPHAHDVSKAVRSGLTRSDRDNVTAFVIAKAADEPVGLWCPRSNFGEMLAPFYIGGPTKASALAVFDPGRHGFNAENGLGRRASAKTPDSIHCSRCGHDRFVVTAKFEYGEPEDDANQEQPRPHDLFTWFWLEAKCASCKHKGEIASVECA